MKELRAEQIIKRLIKELENTDQVRQVIQALGNHLTDSYDRGCVEAQKAAGKLVEAYLALEFEEVAGLYEEEK